MMREELLRQIAEIVVSLDYSHPLRIALDGIDAAGKTTLANELVPRIEAQGRPVIRASVDDFHRPRRERYQRGSDSPEGYYEDAFDYVSVKDVLLAPLGPQGSRRYRRAVFDVQADIPFPMSEAEAPANSILLFDGVFLLRSELDSCWDYRIFVHVDFEIALQRAMVRDQHLFGSQEDTRTRYLQRYIPGQQLYFQRVHPLERANMVIDNNDPAHPQLFFP